MSNSFICIIDSHWWRRRLNRHQRRRLRQCHRFRWRRDEDDIDSDGSGGDGGEAYGIGIDADNADPLLEVEVYQVKDLFVTNLRNQPINIQNRFFNFLNVASIVDPSLNRRSNILQTKISENMGSIFEDKERSPITGFETMDSIHSFINLLLKLQLSLTFNSCLSY